MLQQDEQHGGRSEHSVRFSHFPMVVSSIFNTPNSLNIHTPLQNASLAWILAAFFDSDSLKAKGTRSQKREEKKKILPTTGLH